MKKVVRLSFYTILAALLIFYLGEVQIKRRCMGPATRDFPTEDALTDYYQKTHQNCILPLVALLKNIHSSQGAEESLSPIHSLIHDMKMRWTDAGEQTQYQMSYVDEYKLLKKLLRIDSDYSKSHARTIEELVAEYRRLESHDFYGYGHLQDLLLAHIVTDKDGELEIAWSPASKLRQAIDVEIFQDTSFSFIKEIFFPRVMSAMHIKNKEDFSNYTVYQLCEAFHDSRNKHFNKYNRAYAYAPKAAYLCTRNSMLVPDHVPTPYYVHGQAARFQVNRKFIPDKIHKKNVSDTDFERISIATLHQLSYEDLRGHKQFVKTTRHPQGGDSIVIKLNKPCSLRYMIIDFDPTRSSIVAVTFLDELDDNFLLHIN